MADHRPWAIGPSIGGSPYPSIVDPAGDAELGDWMIAERVRRPEYAELIIRAVNAHEILMTALDTIANSDTTRGHYQEIARAALKAAGP